MSKAPKRAKAHQDAPKRNPQPLLAQWLRNIANHAEEGNLTGFAAVVMVEGAPIPITNIADPTGAGRLTLAGAIAQLHHMLQATEHNDRMSSLARRPDPANA